MKYTIFGFNQNLLCQTGLDLEDSLILQWFIDFYSTGGMVSEKPPGEQKYYFVWLNYQYLLDDLPILKIKKDSLYRRFKKYCNLGILRHWTKKKGGTYSFYCPNMEFFHKLKYSTVRKKAKKQQKDPIPDPTDLNPDPTDSDPGGADPAPERSGKNSGTGTDSKSEQNILLLNNQSTKDRQQGAAGDQLDPLEGDQLPRMGDSRRIPKWKKEGYPSKKEYEKYMIDTDQNLYQPIEPIPADSSQFVLDLAKRIGIPIEGEPIPEDKKTHQQKILTRKGEET